MRQEAFLSDVNAFETSDEVIHFRTKVSFSLQLRSLDLHPGHIQKEAISGKELRVDLYPSATLITRRWEKGSAAMLACIRSSSFVPEVNFSSYDSH